MLTGASRTEAARLVREGKVTVGDSVVSTRSTPLAEGSRLCVEGMVAADAPLLAEPDVSVDVVYDDDDVIVVNKQAGLVVHPGAGRTQGTLAAGLLARYPISPTSWRLGRRTQNARASCTGSTAARRACSSSAQRGGNGQPARPTGGPDHGAALHRPRPRRGERGARRHRRTHRALDAHADQDGRGQGGRSARTAYEVLGRTEDQWHSRWWPCGSRPVAPTRSAST